MSACLFLLTVFTSSSETELLHFTAPWCHACQESEPAVKRLESSGYPVRHFNVDERPDVARRFQVKTVPSFVLVANGRVVNRLDRGVSYQDLVQLVRSRSAPATSASTSASRGDNNRRQPSQVPLRESSSSSGQRSAMAATVRLRVEDATGHSFGTGTIIDVHKDEALILTCGHIFNESRGRGRIHIDAFNSRQSQTVSGRLLRYDMKNDLALVTCKPPAAVQAVRVASSNASVRQRVRVFSIGCNRGGEPTIMNGQVKAIDRYLGPPSNIVVSGTPVDGRSGGGLFTENGQLIGVCQNADPELNEGIYGFLPSVHQYLDRANLAFIYKHPKKAVGSFQSEPKTLVAGGQLPLIQKRDSAIAPAELQNVGFEKERLEVVCIIRSKDKPESKSRVVVIDRPSSEFMDRLRFEQSSESHQITELRIPKRRKRR